MDAEPLTIRREVHLRDSLDRPLPTRASQALLSNRIAFWPGTVPLGTWSGIVSSRLGRRLDLDRTSSALFERACQVIQQRNDVLLSTSHTTTARFVAHAVQWLGVQSLTIYLPSRKLPFESWLRHIAKLGENIERSSHDVWISPTLDKTNSRLETAWKPLLRTRS